MTTYPPYTSVGFNARGLTVRLSGRNPVSGYSFDAELYLAAGSASYRAERPFDEDETLQLEISANFHSDKWTSARVEIAGFLGVEMALLSSNGLDIQIQHRKGTGKNCHLLCLESGETSNGPCLTCPDGPYYIRICC